MKAIVILDNINKDDIRELRANIKVDLYGEIVGTYNNMTLKPIPEEFTERVLANTYEDGWNDCLEAILEEENNEK